MVEYIEREALIKKLNEAPAYFDSGDIRYGIDIATQQVIEQPTADVVEVVRCGQCKNWKINPNNLYGGQCRFSECASIDHFCSRGERKERKDGAKNG